MRVRARVRERGLRRIRCGDVPKRTKYIGLGRVQPGREEQANLEDAPTVVMGCLQYDGPRGRGSPSRLADHTGAVPLDEP